MGQALYRKYRSKKLSAIVGQDHITKTLNNALKSGKISHAYLFTGPHGTGKTSVARILAHEINNLPYTDDSTHLDIIEIDAASNRRIDEIRDLREKVHIAPSSAKYKVYIIDEVHMLTKESFNALLKTLEEPPAHVIFILATTEAHKLPETIVSRTQRYTFKPIEPEQAYEYLAMIAKKEGIKIDNDALKLLVQHGQGSFRDTIGLLDQIANYDSKVTKNEIGLMLGLAPDGVIEELLESMISGSPTGLVAALDKLAEIGVTPTQVAKQLSKILRDQILKRGNDDDLNLAGILEELLEVPASMDPSGKLEVILLKNCVKTGVSNNTHTENLTSLQPPTPTPAKPEMKVNIIEKNEEELKPYIATTSADNIDVWWQKVLSMVKGHNNTLYGVLRMASPKLVGKELSLSFAFPFHAKKISSEESLKKLKPIIEEVLGKGIQVSTKHDKSLKSPSNPEINIISGLEVEPKGNSEDNTLQNITSIFGGGEVIEDQ